MGDETEIYEDKAGEWRWRRKAGNHEIIADSGEGYESRPGAIRAANRVFPPVTPPPGRWAVFGMPFLLGLILGLSMGFAIGQATAQEDSEPTTTSASEVTTTLSEVAPTFSSSVVTSPPSSSAIAGSNAFGVTTTISPNAFTPTPDEEGNSGGAPPEEGDTAELVETL
jgi:uncharacterized protein YegP (UPF0339 family)